KETGTQKEFESKIRTELAYMPYAPIVFISAMTGQRVDNLYPIINEVYEQNNTRITTGQLNSILAEATTRVQPPTDKGKRLKVYYMTQIGVKPPTFVCFCNDAKLFHYSYLRYLENRIRDVYGFKGTPIKMIVRQRGEQE
ncbi:MAG: ribosome biogenesis GTPase Der, partial [Clostridia bacterium]|nr:ribosome biogenesis GTPase Der [Clostridia bacterium]